MQLHFIKTPEGRISVANWPFRENEQDSVPYEVTEEQIAAVETGEKDWDIVDDAIALRDSTRKADAEAQEKALQEAGIAARKRKFELIQKVTSGTATLAEQEEFANLL